MNIKVVSYGRRGHTKTAQILIGSGAARRTKHLHFKFGLWMDNKDHSYSLPA